jgi:hypothetical protein
MVYELKLSLFNSFGVRLIVSLHKKISAAILHPVISTRGRYRN